MKKVVICGRVSTQSQEWQRQVEELRSLAKSKGWEVVKVFTEKISGAKANSELKQTVKDVKVRYGLGKIPEDVYTDTIDSLNSDLDDITLELQDCSRDLSNLEPEVGNIVTMCCKLGELWGNGDFYFRQKLQKLVYPEGIFFDKKKGEYRTENENEVFKIFRRLLSDYKEEATSSIPTCRLGSG